MQIPAQKTAAKLSPYIPCLICFALLLFLRDFLEVPIPSFLFLVIALVIAAFAEKNEVVAFCFCCIPALNAFQTKYALWFCMLIYAVRFPKKKFAVASVVPILFLFFWELGHNAWDAGSPVETVRLFTELFFCCFVMLLAKEDLDFNRIVRSMSAIALWVCFIILLSQLKANSFQLSTLFSGVFRLGRGVDETVMSVGFNPNYLSYMTLCCTEGLACIFYKGEHRGFDIFAMAALSLFGLLTMSKKFILCAVFFLFLFAICRKKKLRTILGIAVLVAVVWIIFKQGFPTAYEALLARFEEEDLSTGRNEIFLYFHERLSEDASLLFFGVGLQDYRNKLITRYVFSIPHNGFQELLMMWGIPGFVAFVLFLWLMVRRAQGLNRGAMQRINYAPFLVMLLNVQVTQMASSSLICVLFAFVYLCLVSDLRSKAARVQDGCETVGGSYVCQ